MATGHVESLKRGFRAVVYAGKDPITSRKIYLKEAHPIRVAAEDAKNRLVAQVESDRVPGQAATLAYLLDRWVEVADHELTTRETNEGYIRRTLKPALGEMALRKLQHRVDILDRLYTHLRRCSVLCDGRPFIEHRLGKGAALDGSHDCGRSKCAPHSCKPMGPDAVRRVHAILSAALSYAVSWGWIERNPAQHAHPPKLNRRRPKPPEPGLVAELVNRAWEGDAQFGLYLWLAVTTGARRGELAALRWSSCDLQRGELLLDDNYVVRSGVGRIKGTKTEDPRRLSIDSFSVQLLGDFHAVRSRALQPAGIELAQEAFVFSPDPAGLRPWHPDHFTHSYGKLAKQLGIRTPLRNLRHFNATQLLAGGVDLRTVAGRLGHSDGGATTMRVYAHWVRPADRRAAELLAQELHQLRQVAGTAAGKWADETSAHGVETAFPSRPAARPIEALLPPKHDRYEENAATASPYQRIAADLRAAIDAGALAGGDLVPTVHELAGWYGVSQSTAQRTMTLLATEGRLVIRRGARTTVAPAVI